jgi:hypothetical protein
VANSVLRFVLLPLGGGGMVVDEGMKMRSSNVAGDSVVYEA